MQIVPMLIEEVEEFVSLFIDDYRLNSFNQNARLACDRLGPSTILIVKAGFDFWAVGPTHPSVPADSVLYLLLRPSNPNKVIARLYDGLGLENPTHLWGISIDDFAPILNELKCRWFVSALSN